MIDPIVLQPPALWHSGAQKDRARRWPERGQGSKGLALSGLSDTGAARRANK